MKLPKDSSDNLKSQIRKRFQASGRSYAEIGGIAGVHSSQVSRICRGQFRTLSHNVVQVCKALGVEAETIKVEQPAEGHLAQRLAHSVLKVWDRTPKDAKRLERFLNDLAALRRSSKSDVS